MADAAQLTLDPERGGMEGRGGGEGGVKFQRIVNVYILLLMKRIDETFDD